MVTIELQLDEQTLARARRLAEARNCTLEELVKELIEQIGVAEPADDTLLGMFRHEASLIDEIVESALMSRQEHPLRQSLG